MDSLSAPPIGVAGSEYYDSASRIEQRNGIITTGGNFTMRDYNINQTHYHNVRDRVLSPEKTKQALIKSLAFQGMNERFESVEENTRNTCQWILETLGFCEWQTSFDTQTSRRLLWIKGQPGTGKSTYMKFVVRHIRYSMGFGDNLIVAHFFNARAPNELAKSTEGMYRTILTQILQDLSPGSVQQLALRFGTARESTWKLETLSSLFRAVLREHNNRPVTCFIDALDECAEDQIRAMIRSFRDLADEEPTKLQFRACFASRYYPNIMIPDDVAIEFRLNQQSGHFRDIETYIARHLHVSSSRIADIVREEVRKKARGSFIWCRLVVDILNKECDRGALNQERILKEKLSTLPEDLRGVYREVLGLREGAPRDPNAKATTLCMQWVLFSANRDIGPLWWAIQRTAQSQTEAEDLEDDYQSYNLKSMQLYILNMCKGLLEVVDFVPLEDGEFGELQVIHESVREFLLEGGLAQLMNIPRPDDDSGNIEAIARSHDRLKEITFDEGFRQHEELFSQWPSIGFRDHSSRWGYLRTLRRRNPLLVYSWNCIHHANEAQRVGSNRYGLDQSPFLKELGQATLMDRYWKIHILIGESRPGHQSLTSILIQQGAEDLLRAYYRRPWGVEHAKSLSIHQHLRSIEIHGAILRAVFDILLDWHGPGSPRHVVLERLASDVDFEGLPGCIPDLWDDIVLDIGWMDPNLGVLLLGALLPSTAEAETVLATWEKTTKSATATRHTFASFLSLVLAHVTPSEAAHILDLGMTLCWAAKRGDQALIRLLLGRSNAACNAQQKSGKTPLHLAVQSRHISVVGSLISRADIDPNARDVNGNTALHHAVNSGADLDMIEMLAGSGWLDVNAKNNNGETALHLSVERDVTAITTQALLSIPKVDTNVRNSNGDTPLHYAVYRYRHYPTAMQALLAADEVDVNATSNTGNTPLHLAVGGVMMKGMAASVVAASEGATKKLLATGKVNINARNNDNETAKDVAQRCNHGHLVNLLTDWASLQDAAPESASSTTTRHSGSPGADSPGEDRPPLNLDHLQE